MPIDANILLQGIVPDFADSAAKGLALGERIKQGPARSQLLDLQVGEAKRNEGTAKAQTIASLTSGLSEEDLLNPDIYEPIVGAFANITGSEIRPENQTATPQSVGRLLAMRDSANNSLKFSSQGAPTQFIGGGEILTEDTGEVDANNNKIMQNFKIITQGNKQTGDVKQQRIDMGTFTGDNPLSIRRITEAGNIAKSTVVGTVGGESETKKTTEAIARDLETAKEEGKDAAKIRDDIKSPVFIAAQQARRSKPNLLVLSDALSDIKTGRIAAARDKLGGVIPGVKDANVEVFQTLVTKFALAELAKQSGTKTDFDMEKAQQTVAELGNTQEANEIIMGLMLDGFDRAENEERQLKAWEKSGKTAENFEFTPVPPNAQAFLRANDTPENRKQFKAKFGFIPSGL